MVLENFRKIFLRKFFAKNKIYEKYKAHEILNILLLEGTMENQLKLFIKVIKLF